jgi:hypothetical protein
MKRRLLVAVPLLLSVALLAWLFRPKREPLGQAYVSERTLTLFNSLAQVRQSVGVLHYGERVEVLGRRGENVRVRTSAGTTGWVDGQRLMDPPLWQRSIQLLAQVRDMPVQSRGRTKVSTNVRVQPGRSEPRLYQFNRGSSVEVLARAVADWVQVPDEKESAAQPGTKKEDWFLVRGAANRGLGEGGIKERDAGTGGETGDGSVPVAGWVVARFIELDLPDAIREGAASAGMRVLAWFELNRVPDRSGEKPQYLVAGARGPEGQPCDFTMLRVYTWGAKRGHYETAFIANDLCGKMPIRVGKSTSGDPEFRFAEMGDSAERLYRMRQTVVRRVREEVASRPPSKAPPGR